MKHLNGPEILIDRFNLLDFILTKIENSKFLRDDAIDKSIFPKFVVSELDLLNIR